MLVDAARASGQLDPRLELRIVSGRNRGAVVRGRAAEPRKR
jgi:beta-ribofuranosylaminobenzene 5'-phosphate synthase